MAYDLNKLANLLHIKTLVEKIKEKFATKTDVYGAKLELNLKYDGLNNQVQGINSGLSVASTRIQSLDSKIDNVESSLQSEMNSKLSSVYKAAGSKTFTQLPTPSSSLWGNVYNVTDAFTTTDSFIEGAGKEYPAGTNVVVVQDGSAYKLDVLAGFVDLSGYVEKAKIAADAEVDELLDELFEA